MRSAIRNPEGSNEQATAYGDLSSRVLRRLMERFDSCCALEVINRATDGEIYVFGGAIRRALFADKMFGDMDIMIPNADDRAVKVLDAMKVPFVLNSNDHPEELQWRGPYRRYRWNSLQIDLFQPREFFHGFKDVEPALCFFDLRINALALHLRSGRILDPFRVVSRTPMTDPGINWPRWTGMSPRNVVLLAIRLARIMHEMPELTVSTHDAHLLHTEVVPRIRECNWSVVQPRFPQGKDAFLEVFGTTVLGRVRVIDSDRRSCEL